MRKITFLLFTAFLLISCGTQNDLIVNSISGEQDITEGEDVTIECMIESSGHTQEPVHVQLKIGDKVIESKEVELDSDQSGTATFKVNPQRSTDYTISVLPFDNESDLTNNERMFSVNVDYDVGVINTRFGDIIVEFLPEIAPKHVESFKLHAKNGYFDGTIFHRVIPGFVIQGGDPNSKSDNRAMHGMGGHAAKFFGVGEEDKSDSWMLPAEFSPSPHNRGALSMARAQDPNSAGSQFFICVANVNQLDNKYSVFGNVIKGMDVADMIVNSPRDSRDNPHERVEMNVSIVSKSTIEGLE